jgi:hypothetical protein
MLKKVRQGVNCKGISSIYIYIYIYMYMKQY